jgi:hypothetical protein
MIRKVAGEYICECNDCGEEEYGGTEDDFRKFVERLKGDGWKIRKDGETWEHICPECQG